MTSGSRKMCSSVEQELTQTEEWESDTVVVVLYNDVKDEVHI